MSGWMPPLFYLFLTRLLPCPLFSEAFLHRAWMGQISDLKLPKYSPFIKILFSDQSVYILCLVLIFFAIGVNL